MSQEGFEHAHTCLVSTLNTPHFDPWILKMIVWRAINVPFNGAFLIFMRYLFPGKGNAESKNDRFVPVYKIEFTNPSDQVIIWAVEWSYYSRGIFGRLETRWHHRYVSKILVSRSEKGVENLKIASEME